ncbi:hypothetical protein F4781DRAFT_414768 [Annulohypoxylon bovei var. microspora]|nr:hypothetical protein F4781DRAFT_414768 [Annulohypoxylon bovei var. microspora]
MDISPSKRRALEPIDSNTRNPATTSKLEAPKPIVLSDALSQLDCGAMKRPLDPQEIAQHEEYPLPQPAKRQRVSTSEDAQCIIGDNQGTRMDSCDNDYDIGNDNENGNDSYTTHRRSESPDEGSSMFDNSVIDTSLDTTITEPDAEMGARTPPAPPHRQPSMSREEARQKAEKLRLRLGLASYKVRTGQTDVPLDQLKIKPLMDANKCARLEQPSLPPLPRREDVAVEAENNGEEEQDRPATATSTTLPIASSYCREDSFGQIRPPPGGELLLELQSSKTVV